MPRRSNRLIRSTILIWEYNQEMGGESLPFHFGRLEMSIDINTEIRIQEFLTHVAVRAKDFNGQEATIRLTDNELDELIMKLQEVERRRRFTCGLKQM